MKSFDGIQFISKAKPKGEKVLLRVDFNVTMGEGMRISDDARICEAIPTIKLLLENKNKVVIVSHMGRPRGERDKKYSLSPVARRLHEYLPKRYAIHLVDDFTSEKGEKMLAEQKDNEVMLLENIRFWEGEKNNDAEFAKSLAALGEVYVNDAFGVSHRSVASVVGVTKYLPSFGGLLLKREIEAIMRIVDAPLSPVLSVIGGAKIETKVPVIKKLIEFSDTIFIGGAIANTFLAANGKDVGKSLVDEAEIGHARQVVEMAKKNGTELLLPLDVVVGKIEGDSPGEVVDVEDVLHDKMILDIGPQTQALLGERVNESRKIIWNGPLGYNEDGRYDRGTEFLFYSIAGNEHAKSLVGGGDTIVSIARESHLDEITHISTGGGAMLEFIENETLPGIEALRKAKN